MFTFAQPTPRRADPFAAFTDAELEELAAVLSEAAVEILNYSDRGNPVYRRVREQERIVREKQV